MTALALFGVAMMPSMYAQKAVHLFYKDGNHETIEMTPELKAEFHKESYLNAYYHAGTTDTIHLSASSGRSYGLGYVEYNTDWDISTNDEWLLVRKGNSVWEMGQGMLQDYFVVYPTANESDTIREGKVTVSCTDGATKDFVVVQHPYMLTLTVNHIFGNYEQAVIARDEELAWDDTVYWATVYPNHGVKLLSHPDWMEMVDQYNGDDYCQFEDIQKEEIAQSAGSFHSTDVRFRFKQNRTGSARKGNIIFEGNGQTAVLTVTQNGLTDGVTLASLEDIQRWLVQFNIVGSGQHDDFSHMSVLHAADMMAEDMTMFNNVWFDNDYKFSNNAVNYRRNKVNWETYYGLITRANAAIDLANDVKEQVNNENFVLGNAYAYRAMAYLYLVQLFQNPTTENGIDGTLPGVPMLYSAMEQATMSPEQIEYFKGRNTVGEVMAQIETDITRAIELLQGEARPSKNYIDVSVAQGLAARYYLLVRNWEKAASMANAARSGYTVMEGNTEVNGIRDGFMDINNSEWMWGFDHTPETQTTYPSFFSHISNLSPGYSGGYSGRGIDARLFAEMSDTDYRRVYWYRDGEGKTQSTASASDNAHMWQKPWALLKFGWDGGWCQDYLYMRAAEMILIEAEALVRMGKTVEVHDVMRELMTKRDPNWGEATISVEDVYLQRRLELIGEGHAYFDLKRLCRGVERNYEGSNHLEGYKINVLAGDKSWIYKIPQVAIDNDRVYNLTEADNQ